MSGLLDYHDTTREISIRRARLHFAVRYCVQTNFVGYIACARRVDAKAGGADDMGANSPGSVWWRVAGRHSIQLGICAARRRRYRRRTASEQSPADDIDPRRRRYANRARGKLAIEFFDQRTGCAAGKGMDFDSVKCLASSGDRQT